MASENEKPASPIQGPDEFIAQILANFPNRAEKALKDLAAFKKISAITDSWLEIVIAESNGGGGLRFKLLRKGRNGHGIWSDYIGNMKAVPTRTWLLSEQKNGTRIMLQDRNEEAFEIKPSAFKKFMVSLEAKMFPEGKGKTRRLSDEFGS